jgi:hypothetical protein
MGRVRMFVAELIEELKKYRPEDIVMYDRENAQKNPDYKDSTVCGIDEVVMGIGTERGFVYLQEELLK